MNQYSSSNNKIPKSAIIFANIIFILLTILCLLISLYAFYRLSIPIYSELLKSSRIQNFYLASVIFSSFFGILSLLCLIKLKDTIKVNLSILFFSVGISLYGFEIYLEYSQVKKLLKSKKVIINDNLNDTRTVFEVIKDLRKSGVSAYPNITSVVEFETEMKIHPLGTISNITTTLGNENGYYSIINTDEHGFNNPKGLYKNKNIDIALVGDSFAEGAAVNYYESISGILNKLNYKSITLGKSGKGPLFALATIKEYAKQLKPKYVLWMFFENDLDDLGHEMRSSILTKYLDDDEFSQNLISKQHEIDKIQINHALVELNKKNQAVENITNLKNFSFVNSLNNSLKFYNLRKILGVVPKPESIDYMKTFKNILFKSNSMINNWGGKMIFVYLPGWENYSTVNSLNKKLHLRNNILKTVNELNIRIIDMHKEVFETHPDALSLFPFRMNGHYNVEGYQLVAETIGKRLEKEGLLY